MKILVPIDGSKNSMQAVKAVGDIANNKDDIHLVTVIPFYAGLDLEISAKQMTKLEETMKKRGEEIIEKAATVLSDKGITPKSNVSSAASAADEIIDVATKKKIDLIVIGSQGLGGASTRFFMGSVASKVVSYAPCSVYLIKNRI
jgi:nucleotide-binding universal stress UspA family protein